MFPFDIDESDIEDNPEQVIDDDSGESEEEDGNRLKSDRLLWNRQ